MSPARRVPGPRPDHLGDTEAAYLYALWRRRHQLPPHYGRHLTRAARKRRAAGLLPRLGHTLDTYRKPIRVTY